MNDEKPKKAAFYDLDGTLLSCNLVTTYAYYARNDRSILKSIYQFLKVLVNVPLFFGLDLYSRAAFNVFFFRAYRGMHRDRLVGLADDLFEVTLKPSIYDKSEVLVSETREQGYQNVLVTGALGLHGSAYRSPLRLRRDHLQPPRVQKPRRNWKSPAAVGSGDGKGDDHPSVRGGREPRSQRILRLL